MDSLSRPIIILGSPRSGTTLLGNLLSEHPDLTYAEEPRLVWRRGNDQGSDCFRPEHARPEVVRGIRSAFDEQVRAGRGSRLLEKTPSNALRVGFVDRVLPDAIYVHVIRNGFDAALSIRAYTERHGGGVPSRGRIVQRLREARPSQIPHYAGEFLRRVTPDWVPGRRGPLPWGPRLPGMSALAAELTPLQLAALQWRWCVEAAAVAGRDIGSDRFLTLRLEDFDRDRLLAILEHCGLDAHPAVLERFATDFRPDDPTARSSRADPAAFDEIRQMVEPTMAWLEREAPNDRREDASK